MTPELRLEVLGGLTLARAGAVVTGAITQRRRLALFACLAVARDRGISRDKLQALLWPESDATHARRTLNQLLYAQRRTVGTPHIFDGRKNLRLNAEMVSTDIAEFEDAIESGQLQRAVTLYRGPFLDGFFLGGGGGGGGGGSQEFERWADDQRRRLARLCAVAISSLAQRATAAGHTDEAVAWWNRAVEHDPLNGRAVACLAESLTSLGDLAGAQRATREYEDRLKNL